jgi:hypothetical protein
MTEAKPTSAAAKKPSTTSASAGEETVFDKQGPNAEPVVNPTENASGKTGSADDPTTANPTIVEGDRLAPNATTSGNSPVPNGTGFHCGMCGRVVSKEGVHFDEEGEPEESSHPNVIVVPDDWATQQNTADQEAAEKHAARRASRKTNPNLAK